MPCTVGSRGCGKVSPESDQLEEFFRRPSENCTPPRQPDRPLDQTRASHHRRNELLSVEGGIRETEFLVLLLLAPHEIARFHAERVEHSIQFRRSRRVLQVLDDLGLDTALAQQADRLP